MQIHCILHEFHQLMSVHVITNEHQLMNVNIRTLVYVQVFCGGDHYSVRPLCFSDLKKYRR